MNSTTDNESLDSSPNTDININFDPGDSNSGTKSDLVRKTVSQMSLSFNLKYNSNGEDLVNQQTPRTFLSYLKLIGSYIKFFMRLFGLGLFSILPNPANVQFELLTNFKKSEIANKKDCDSDQVIRNEDSIKSKVDIENL